MKINIIKTETMAISRQPESLTIKLQNVDIKQTIEAKYLGAIFTADGSIDSEISNRCTKANQVLGQLTPLLSHKEIPLTTKANLIRTIFWPTLCYQCQIWLIWAENHNDRDGVS